MLSRHTTGEKTERTPCITGANSDEKHDRGGIHFDADVELTSLLEFSFKKKKTSRFRALEDGDLERKRNHLDDVPMHTKEMRKESLPHIHNHHAADHFPLLRTAVIADGGNKDFWIPTPVRARMQRMVGLQVKKVGVHSAPQRKPRGCDWRRPETQSSCTKVVPAWCGGSLFRWMTGLGLGDGQVHRIFSETVLFVPCLIGQNEWCQ